MARPLYTAGNRGGVTSWFSHLAIDWFRYAGRARDPASWALSTSATNQGAMIHSQSFPSESLRELRTADLLVTTIPLPH